MKVYQHVLMATRTHAADITSSINERLDLITLTR